MKVENLCERCGKPEKGYSVRETNRKLKRVAKGPARLEVQSFLCSGCVQLNLKREMPQNAPKKAQAEKTA